jgi:hypothetical protein
MNDSRKQENESMMMNDCKFAFVIKERLLGNDYAFWFHDFGSMILGFHTIMILRFFLFNSIFVF